MNEIVSVKELILSPPSRAAWIEIYLLHDLEEILDVAAFTGGVD